MRKFVLVLLVVLLNALAGAQDAVPGPLVEHNGQQLFLSGINLAWINFARDLRDFDEPRFVAALDEIAAARGNTLRWWLHTDGSTSPLYGEDGKVTGLGENDLENLRRGLDLAYERGILVMPTLWSHDMMNTREGIPTDANKLLIENPEYTQAYIDNALVPMVTALAGHPAIVAWEIFNEPEGTTDLGWTDVRTDMASIQQFVNLLAGAIHRADPAAKVTNGSWNMQVLTDVDGFFNYYTDARLVEAGGDPDGTLNFYQVHYYPEWFDETTSPFHNPYSHWELDKPLVIGEFPAKAIANLGMGFRPRKQLRNSMETYEFLLENGYAGALSWTFYESPHGKMLDAAAGMLRVSNLAPDNVRVDIGEIDRIPVIAAPIENLVVNNDVPAIENYVDLNTVFSDAEGLPLAFELTGNSNPDTVGAAISETGALSLTFAVGSTGTASLEITAVDAAGHNSKTGFTVQVVDPNRGNVALGKAAAATTLESTAYDAPLAVDGLPNTRWSSTYNDEQILTVDLGGVFNVGQVVLRWEAAFGQNYEIQVWDGQAWQTVIAEPNSDGQIDDLALPEPVDTRYIRMNGHVRGTEWGFSLWEFEVYGTSVESGDAALETTPPDLAVVETNEQPAATGAETVLHTFEADTEGFLLADYWAGGKGVSAAEGALALALVTTGGSWQEGGVYVQPAGGADWSAYGQLSVDIFVPEGGDGFLSQIFVKTGADWTWANTGDTPLMAGEWTTVTADLSALGELTAVGEYGIKVGSSTAVFDGSVLIDNLRLIAVEQAAPAGDGEMASEETVLNTFDADAEGFQLADYWAGGKGVSAADGTLVLALVTTGGGTWQEGGVFVQPAGGADWSEYAELSVDIYLPEGADGFLSQIFMKTGTDWTWTNTPDTALVAGAWTTVTADLSAMGDLGAVGEYGIKIGTSQTAFEGQALIDNIRLVRKTAAAAPAGPVTPSVTAITAVTPLQASVAQYGMIEFAVEMDAAYNNPYDPTEIRLDGRFTSPSGEVVLVPGFYFEDHAYLRGIPVSTGETSWRVRFTPVESGDYSYRIIATTLSGSARSSAGNFTVTASDNPGFVRVDSRNPRYMAFDNGAPYYPIGLNIGWSTGDTIADYTTWLDGLSGAGGNFMRVWMAPWDMAIEWIDTGLGNYDNRQAAAYELDRVVQLAAERDVYMMLSLLNHGQFSTSTNPQWDENPYNSANGGPCDEPACFADNPDAVRLWNQRLRYIVARWGYSPNIMSWEFWNEVNWTPLAGEAVLGPWIQRSAAVIRNLDPYDHLLTTSGSRITDAEVWKDLDYTQDHYYDMPDLQRLFNNVAPEWAAAYPDKPYLIGEFGSPLEIDREGVLIHLGIWSAVMNGASGTGMTWWWDTYVQPNALWNDLFRGISAYLAGEDLAAETWRLAAAEFADRTAARVYGLQTDDMALLWVSSRSYSNTYLQKAYNDNLRNQAADPYDFTFPPVEGSVLVVDGLTDGAYTIEIWNTVLGYVIQTVDAQSAGGSLTVALPQFTKDLALKVKSGTN